jgi:hypothetical protein
MLSITNDTIPTTAKTYTNNFLKGLKKFKGLSYDKDKFILNKNDEKLLTFGPSGNKDKSTDGNLGVFNKLDLIGSMVAEFSLAEIAMMEGKDETKKMLKIQEVDF